MVAALLFDVFGTCVDWRSAITREVAQHVPDVDAVTFADAWRAAYHPAMAPIRDGTRPYIALDELHRENLVATLDAFGATCTTTDTLARAGERRDPWPDTVSGLTALRRLYPIAPCSNGSIALMTHLARHAGLPWDCILGAEIAGTYKPAPATYLASCAALRLAPPDVIFVAAHNDDLRAARACGLATAFVPRVSEHGPDQSKDLVAEEDWDIVARDLDDLALRLGSA